MLERGRQAICVMGTVKPWLKVLKLFKLSSRESSEKFQHAKFILRLLNSSKLNWRDFQKFAKLMGKFELGAVL